MNKKEEWEGSPPENTNGRRGVWSKGDSCDLHMIYRGTHIHLCAREMQLQILREGTEKIPAIDFQPSFSPAVSLLIL